MIAFHHRPPTADLTEQPPTVFGDPTLRPITRIHAAAYRLFGPADGPANSLFNPLTGTRYDSGRAARHRHEQLERRRVKANARWELWNKRLHGHYPVPPPPP